MKTELIIRTETKPKLDAILKIGRLCEVCLKPINQKYSNARFCSHKCRAKAHRMSSTITPSTLCARIQLEPTGNGNKQFRIINIYAKTNQITTIKLTKESKELWELLNRLQIELGNNNGKS